MDYLTTLIGTLALITLARPTQAAEPCPLTEGCVLHGECTTSGDRCVRVSTADCLQSELCQEQSACSYDAASKRCVVATASCMKQPACKAHGFCRRDGDDCVGTDDTCRASTDCKLLGDCANIPLGPSGCHAPDTAACAASTSCRDDGACETYDASEYTTRCGATTTKMCMDSAGCRLFGRCQKDPQGHACQTTESACKRSVECTALGRCAVRDGDSCTAADDAGCEASEACKKYGACKAFAGRCSSLAGPAESCTLVEVSGLSVTTSSEHKATPPYTFAATQLVDRDLRTSWQPASKRGGVGERVTVKLPGKRKLARLDVANGFQLRDTLGDLWSMNNRVERARVVAGAATLVLVLADRSAGFVQVRLPEVETDTIELTVDSIRKGSRWSDLAISELRVWACQ